MNDQSLILRGNISCIFSVLKKVKERLIHTQYIICCTLLYYAVRIGAIYLLSGIGGSTLSCLFIQHSISVGASGALFGLLGAMLSELLTNWTIYSNKVSSTILLKGNPPTLHKLSVSIYFYVTRFMVYRKGGYMVLNG